MDLKELSFVIIVIVRMTFPIWEGQSTMQQTNNLGSGITTPDNKNPKLMMLNKHIEDSVKRRVINSTTCSLI